LVLASARDMRAISAFDGFAWTVIAGNARKKVMLRMKKSLIRSLTR